MDALSAFRIKEAGISAVKDALIREAQKRKGRSLEQWHAAEASAVWEATRDFAQQHGLRVPTLAEVERVERLARGHSDYCPKWALYVVELTFAVEPVASA